MSSYLDKERFAELVRSKRDSKGLREAAREIGNVSPSTLSRVENGKTPDINTFLALCDWLRIPPAELIKNTKNIPKLTKAQSLCLKVKSDPRLSPEIANVLAALIKAAYSVETRSEESQTLTLLRAYYNHHYTLFLIQY